MEDHLELPVAKKQRTSSQDEDHDHPGTNHHPLPWQRAVPFAFEGIPNLNSNPSASDDLNPGEFVLRALFTEFTVLAEKKIERLLKEPLERPLSKSLQRGEDPQFDQLLSSLSSVAEHCLSSLLRTLFQWYERQTGKDAEDLTRSRSPSRAWGGSESPRPASRAGNKDRDALWERRNLAVEFIFCLVLIEVLKQLSVHPVEESQIQFIENHAFKHFKDQDSGSGTTQSQTNRMIVTALYAEVIGVLAMTRFQSVRRRFMQEYKDNQGNSRVLVNIIMGLKFIRIKLFPVEELEESFLFLQECATLFLERNLDKEVKYAFANLFVELLIPVAATAKREYGIPALKKFVDMLHKDALELARKAKHSSAMYPLVTALLCISQKQFFLLNWNTFLTMCLSHVKSRDTKLQRMAMECLYRLLWVYVIRVKCENHASTLTRLRSITETLFPRNSRTVVPRNIPLNIFVKIIQFIAQEKLDFAMQDIIFDLLNVGRSNRQLNPERMNIGLRAFLVIADKLQRKEGAPPMPSTIGVLPSGNTLKVKKSFTKLTEQAARSIGVVTYYTSVRRALDQILRTLDIQVGRTMTMNNPQISNKEPVDMITGERKPKIDLFRTCVAAIPKCVPEGMSKSELVELVSRLTLHLDEELKSLAFTALQSLIMDFPEYREEVILGYINFTLREVPDIYPNILESCVRGVFQLVAQWRTAISQPSSESKGDQYLEMSMNSGNAPEVPTVPKGTSTHVVHCIEGFALVMLCSTKAMHRKLALMVLREVRLLAKAMQGDGRTEEVMAIDIIEECAPAVIEKALTYISGSDKASLGLSPLMDLHLLAEKSALLAEKDSNVAGISRDVWAHCFSGFLDRIYTHQNHCSCTFQYSWPFVYNRLFYMYTILDPSVDFDSISSRASISVKAPKKPANLSCIWLWRNYLIFACCTPPKSALSKVQTSSSSQEMLQSDAEVKSDLQITQDIHSLSDVFKSTVLLIKSESPEIREATVTGLGKTVAAAHSQLIEEMHILLREVLDRKAEGVRKKKKRDLLRLQVARVLAANAEQGCFKSSLIRDGERAALVSNITEYVEGMRYILEIEVDKEDPTLIQLRLFFSKFIHKMIKSIPPSLQGNLLRNQTRHNLFLLLAGWCGHFNVSNFGTSKNNVAQSSELEFSALEAMCALVCCGEVFDQKALEVSNGYLYKLLDTMLGSDNAKVHSLGQESVELLLENNERIPALLNWVIDRCYTGSKGVSSGCFLSLANVFCNRLYPCRLVPLICVVLFKTNDGSAEIRERAAQLLHLLDRRFFSYTAPFRTAYAGYSYNQQNFSRDLAVTHPELTLPMLAEMTFRFETTSMVGQRCLLNFQLPWLENIELVNVSLPRVRNEVSDEAAEEFLDNNNLLRPLNVGGDGWGSVEATQMVLTNLFYITAKYDEYFSKEIEALWSSLCATREANVHLVIEYLIVMASLCGAPALPHAKKVAVYVSRANTTKTVDELMKALRLTETVSANWERLDQPPYYRFIDKAGTASNTVTSPESKSITPVQETSSDCDMENAPTIRVMPSERQGSEERSGSCGSAKAFAESVLEGAKQSKVVAQCEHQRKESGTDELWPFQWMLAAHASRPRGIPLPIPEESTYFAPITCIFPLTMLPAHLYRCNFGVMMLTEIVSDRPEVQWIINLPLMLHVSFLGLDHMKPLVHEHCKRLLINLVVVLVCRGERSTVAKALLDFQSVSNIALDRSISVKGSINVIAEEGSVVDEQGISDAENLHRSSPSVSQSTERDRLNNGDEHGLSVEEKARELIEFLTKSDCRPLWPFEDITPRNVAIKSAEQLEAFLRMVISIFEEAVPHAHLLERWGYESLHWATSCSSRHYAGRSFQVFRGIRTPLTWTMLSDVLRRFTESVAEQTDEMQGYVMEILLTFLSAVSCAFAEAPKPHFEDFLYSGMDNQSMDDLLLRLPGCRAIDSAMTGHSRSYSTDFQLGYPLRQRSGSEGHLLTNNHKRYASELILSRPASCHVANVPSLKELTDFQQLPKSPLDMLARLFWVGVSLLESDFDHEFDMAISLIEKVLQAMDLRKSEGLERVEKIFGKLNWHGFPGLQSLLLKGLTSSVTADSTLHLLAKLTTMTNISIIDPSPASGLSLNILALLPTLINHFDEVNEHCAMIAGNIAKACEIDKSLSNLGKIMILYKEKEYSKPVQTWIEVVCKYILDVFPHLSTTMLALLVEILEQGPTQFQQPVLRMICAILKYSDASSPGLKQFHGHLLKVVTAHVKDVNLWKESLNILKLVVSNSSQINDDLGLDGQASSQSSIRSSILFQPRASMASLLSVAPKLPWGSSLTLAENAFSVSGQSFRRELPGRTLEFTYDVTATPLIGAKFDRGSKDGLNEGRTDDSSGSSSTAVSCWRKPHGSQKRTRERLVQLLPLCGHRGALKSSLSVIFSSSSDLAVESKHAASSGEASGDEQGDDKMDETGFSGRQLRNVFTEFDFLDDELDKESEDMSSFGWASTTELRKDESLENLRNMPSTSRSGSEEELREIKDDDLSDEDESVYGSSIASVLTSLKESAVDEDFEESDHEESPVHSVMEVRTDQVVNDKPQPSPASICSYTSTLDGMEEQVNDIITEPTPGEEKEDLFEELTEPRAHIPIFAVAAYDEVPSRWSLFVTSFMSAPTIKSAVESMPYFPLILKASCCWLQSLTRDCCEEFQAHLEAINERYKIVTQKLESQLHMPYVFIDKDTFEKAELLARHKSTTLKLNESIRVLQEKREQALEQLESVQRHKNRAQDSDKSYNFQFFGPDSDNLRTKNNPLLRGLANLGSCLNRLHVQFILCLEIYLGYLSKIVKSTQKLEANDLSDELIAAEERIRTLKVLPTHSETKEKPEFQKEASKDDVNTDICPGEGEISGVRDVVTQEGNNAEDSAPHEVAVSEATCQEEANEDELDIPYVETQKKIEDNAQKEITECAEVNARDTFQTISDCNDIDNNSKSFADRNSEELEAESAEREVEVGIENLKIVDEDAMKAMSDCIEALAREADNPNVADNTEVTQISDANTMQEEQEKDGTDVTLVDSQDVIEEENEANISVAELRLNSAMYLHDKPPTIETMLEKVIISSSFFEEKGKDQTEVNEAKKFEEVRVTEEEIIDNEDSSNDEEVEELAKLLCKSEEGKVCNTIDTEEEEQYEIRISDVHTDMDMSSVLYHVQFLDDRQKQNAKESDVLTMERVMEKIASSMDVGQFKDALELLRSFRGYPDVEDVVIDDNEKDILMVLFAKNLLKNKTSVFAITNSLEGLADTCDQLSECMAEMLALICVENEKKC
ncbi:protein furry homolog-like isoform X2 [Rhopilema esculentum]|uniref:protein furry homolog-like isoform X2 n=1 Tax=Rhopilema esculentum TaxID=499914 RepID=UPI0031D48AD5